MTPRLADRHAFVDHSSHCYDTLVMTSAKPQCAHCDTLLDKKKPSVELKREGTGFAAGGQVEAKRVSRRRDVDESCQDVG
jgi:hypothetical protein